MVNRDDEELSDRTEAARESQVQDRVDARLTETEHKKERDEHQAGSAAGDPSDAKTDISGIEPGGVPGGVLRDKGPS